MSVPSTFAAIADADFAKRCADPGVVKCVNFDSASDIAGRWTNNSGITIGASTPAIDTTVKSSGAGSLLFTIPSQSWGDSSGSYFTNFSPDLATQFGENSEFFVQWRQRFSPEFVSIIYEGNSGIKQAIITTGDQPGKVFASCESTGVVLTTYNQARVPILYQSCTGSESHGPYDAFLEPVVVGNAPVDFKLQNGMPSPFCLWKDGQYNTAGSNCVKWVPNEWMTFQIRIKTGPRVGNEFTNSFIQMWIAREGQPSKLVVSWGPYNLSALAGEKFGKVWLLPYQTSKVGTQVTPTAYTWYDELIISRTKIADPGSAPLAVNLTAPADNVTVPVGASVNVSASVTDVAGPVGRVEFYRDSALIGTLTTPSSGTATSGTWTFSDTNVSAGTYAYTAKAYDSAGVIPAVVSAGAHVTVTASPVNVAAQSNGGIASASSFYSGAAGSFSPSAAINGDRKGQNWGATGAANSGWNDSTSGVFPDWLQVNFSGTYTVSEVDVVSVQDNYTAPVEPTSSMTFTKYGLVDFQVQYWNGSAWLEVPGGSITGNNLVVRRITFAPVSTSAVRVVVNKAVDTWSRLAELEVWTGAGSPAPVGAPNVLPTVSLTAPAANSVLSAPGTINLSATAADSDGAISKVELYRNGTLIVTAPAAAAGTYTYSDANLPAGTYSYTVKAYDSAIPAGVSTSDAKVVTVSSAAPPNSGMNVAAQANGGVASASSFYEGTAGRFRPAAAINSDRKGQNWGAVGAADSGWNDFTASAFPDVLQVNFAGTFNISEVDVFSVQDNYKAPIEPTPSMTFTKYGLVDFQVQYWNGTAWNDVPGGNITGNNLVWRRVSFAPVATSAIRVVVNRAVDTWSRIAELEAWVMPTSGTNTPPLAVLASPANNTMLTGPGTVNLSVNASDVDGTISKVEFYRDATLVSTVTSPTAGTASSGSWGFSDTNVPVGTYTYTAKVYDSGTAVTTVTPALVTVTAMDGSAKNVAAQINGGSATASTFYVGSAGNFSPSAAINGDRKGQNWGATGTGNSGWNDSTPGAFPDSLQVNFAGTFSVGQIDVFSPQDNYKAPVDPTSAMTFTQYGLVDFQVQYWDGTTWLDVPGGNITGNNLVWRRIAFPTISTNAIRVVVNKAVDQWSRITEVEAWATGVGGVTTPPTTPTSPPTDTGGGTPTATTPNPVLNSLPAGTAMHLGPYTCTDVDGEFSGKCKIVTDYSGMTFDKKRREFLVFGGGHTSTNYDGLNAFNMNTLSWKEKYKPTGCSAMLTPGNFDGATGTWRSAPSGPAPRPIARHTVDLMAVAENTDELVMLTYVEGNGMCAGWSAYNGFNFVTPGKIGQFNLATNQWTFSDAPNEMQWPAAEYDPISKMIIIVGLDGLEIYDPVSKLKAKAIDFSTRYIPDDQGALLSFGIFRYNNNLVYYPPNQKMYYFDRVDHRVIEITLDRTNWPNSKVVALTTTGTPSGHPEPGYAYDAANQVIGGAVYLNKFYAFNPLTKSWTSQDILGGAPGNEAFHAIGYDDANNVFVFITEDRQTWAYRYK